MNKTRRYFSGPEMVATLKRHLLEQTPVSDRCDELGIGANLFYRWQRESFRDRRRFLRERLQSNAVQNAKQRKIEQLEAKLQRKIEVLSELVEEDSQLGSA